MSIIPRIKHGEHILFFVFTLFCINTSTTLLASNTLEVKPTSTSIRMDCGDDPIAWFRNYGGTNSETAQAIQQTLDGGFIMTGHTLSDDVDLADNNGGVDFWVVKTDVDGNIQWEKTYGGSSTDTGKCIHQTDDGNYIVCGQTISNDGDVGGTAGNFDYWALKLDNVGNIIWSEVYGGSGGDNPAWLEPTLDGGFVIVGHTFSNDGDIPGDNNGATDIFVIKIDTNGAIQWTKTIGGSDEDQAAHISVTPDNGFVISGRSFSLNGDIVGNNGLTDAILIKLDSAGNIEWSKNMGGSNEDEASMIKPALDGGYIATGLTRSNNGDFTGNNGGGDAWVSKLDANGNVQWTKLYGGNVQEEGNTILCTPEGGYIFAGRAFSSNGDVGDNNGLGDVWLVNLDANGNILSETNYGGSMLDFPNDLRFTDNGGIVMCGFTESTDMDITDSRGQADFWAAYFATPITLPPAIALGDDTTICNGESIQLNAVDPNCPNCTYNWDAPISGGTPSVSPIVPTTYSVTVTNASGCTTTDAINIGISDLALNVLQAEDPTPCGFSDGLIEVAASGGSNTYNYTWNTPNTGNLIQNLDGGNYQVTVNDGNCEIVRSIALDPSIGEIPVVDLGSDQSACEGQTITVDAQNPSHSFLWSNDATTQTIAVSESGTFVVTVTTADGCTASDVIDIVINDNLSIDLGQDINTCDQNINLNAGLSGMDYHWSSTSDNFQNININESGTYEVTVTSPSGCTGTDAIEVYIGTIPTVDLGADQMSCTPVTLDVTNTDFTYNWSSTNDSTPTIEASTTGSYSLTVTNSDGCTATDAVFVDILQNVNIDLGSDVHSCDPVQLASNLNDNNLTYTWSNASSDSNIEVTESGWYTLTASDLDGCSDTDSVYVTIAPQVELALEEEIITCSSATLDAELSGLSYQWSTLETTQIIEVETSGWYYLTATNTSGCSDQDSIFVSISDSIELNLEETISGCEVAELDAGVNELNYTWYNETTQNAINVNAKNIQVTEAGLYSLTVTDGMGCSDTDSVYVEIYDDPSVDLGEYAIGCQEVELNTNNPDDMHEWSTGSSTSNTNTVTSSGTVAVTITNDQGCSASDSIQVIISSNIEIGYTATPPTCADSQDGSLIIIPTNGVGTYMINWNHTTSNTPNLNNISSGTYPLTVTDGAGCTTAGIIEVEGPEPITSSFQVMPIGCNGVAGLIDMEVIGGTGDYEYEWSNMAVEQDIAVQEANTYTVQITDENACTAIGEVAIEQIAPIEIEVLSTTDNICAENTDGSINVAVTGGTGAYTYVWSDPNTNEPLFPNEETTLNNLLAGDYQLFVNDQDGCEATQIINITAPDLLAYNLTGKNGCGEMTGAANIMVTGGTLPYEYTWSNNSMDDNIFNVTSGTYTVTVEDANNCTFVDEVTIENYESVEFEVSSEGISCNGEADGQISITPTNGVAPFKFDWDTEHEGSEITDLPAGEYSAFVSDANGCLTIESVLITEPDVLSAIFNVIPPINGNGRTVEAIVQGGTPSFQYLWNTGDTEAIIEDAAIGNYSVNITDQNGCTTFAQTALTATNNIEIIEKFELSPNPTNGTFLIEAQLENYQTSTISLYTLLGEKLIEEQLNSKNIKLPIDINNYPKGIYLVELRTDTHYQVKRIILQ